jgi:hypothetical protein
MSLLLRLSHVHIIIYKVSVACYKYPDTLTTPEINQTRIYI